MPMRTLPIKRKSMKKSAIWFMMFVFVLSTVLGGIGASADYAYADSSTETNLVLNPGFEDGKDHWTFAPEGKAGTNVNNPQSGQGHAWTDPSTDPNVKHTITQQVIIPETGLYKLSAFVTNNGAAGGSMSINGHSYPFASYGFVYQQVVLQELEFEKGEEATITFTGGAGSWLNIDSVSFVNTSINQLAEVSLDGQVEASYNLYKRLNPFILPQGTATAPVVTAELSEWAIAQGASISFEQAAALPGTAKINVTINGETTTHRLSFQARSGEPLESIKLSATETVLPLDGETQLSVIGTLPDGTTIDLLQDPNSTVEFQAPPKMFIIAEDGSARAGTYSIGDVQVGVTVTRDGDVYTDAMTVTIKPESARPYVRDYTETLTMKLFLGKTGTIDLNLEEALEAIKKMDNMTRGIPKIVYLVGWQHDGHDSKYPDWNLVNPRLKREQDATALDSLKWLMDEAVKYNTTVSLHINMTDAYEDSPQWNEFKEKDLLRKEANGELIKGGLWVSGQSYRVNLTRAWEAGVLQRNIDDLIEMLPQLQRGGTIHIDAFVTNYVPSEPDPNGYSSPYHQTTFKQDTETQKKIIRYWRDKGIDFTSEYFQLYREDPLYGIQPMAWWADWPSFDAQMKLPASVAVGGRGGNELLGISMHGEDIVMKDKENLPGYLQEFSTTTLVWQYLNKFERISYDSSSNKVTFSDNVTSSIHNGKHIVKQGDMFIADGKDVFVPELWRKNTREIMAFSEKGYSERSWKLPADWSDVSEVHLYEIGMGLPRLVDKSLAVVDGQVTLSLRAGRAVYIVPAVEEPVLDPIQKLAMEITEIAAPEVNAIKLKLPEVPAGYMVRVASTSQPETIDLKGRIIPPANHTDVEIVLELIRIADGVSAHTAPIKVVVPKGTIQTIKDVYSPADAELTGQAKKNADSYFTGGYRLGFVGGTEGNDNRAIFHNVEVPGDGVYEVEVEYATAEPRSFFVSANDEPGIELKVTGSSWQTVQKVKVRIELKAGKNSIQLYNPTGHAPDLGAITIHSIGPHVIADAITEMPVLDKNAKQLVLPVVPAGFTITLKSSDKETIIKPDGSIVLPSADTTVRVILEVRRNYDGAIAETDALPVLVSGKPNGPGTGGGTDPGNGNGNGGENGGNGEGNGSENPNQPGQKQIIIDIPFQLTEEQAQTPGVVSVMRINKDGSKTAVVFSKYDAKKGIVQVRGSKDDEFEVVFMPKKFADLANYSWAEEAIKTLAASGVIKGKTQDRFAPQQAMKRADMAVLLVRMFGLTAELTETDAQFEDVSETAYYYKELAIAKKLGLVQGVSETKFQPEKEVTREQMLVMIERALRQMKLIVPATDGAAGNADSGASGNADSNASSNVDSNANVTGHVDSNGNINVYSTVDSNVAETVDSNVNSHVGLRGFKDAADVSSYATDRIEALVDAGLVKGSNGKLLPKKIANRAETAAMLYRVVELVMNQQVD